MSTEQLYLRDAYRRACDARVAEIDVAGSGAVGDDPGPPTRVALDQTVFYPTGGGQPADTGVLEWGDSRATVDAARKEGPVVWHTIADGNPVPPVGTLVSASVDWDRRYALMRTHSALHVLCGVIWHEWQVPVTGGNMGPLAARMDFELDPTPERFGQRVEALVAAEVAADRPIEVSFVPRADAVLDEALIRTKVNLVPESVSEIRVVDIVGLDKQADGGTHVRSTGEIGRVRVTKTESKGKGNKRIRIVVEDG